MLSQIGLALLVGAPMVLAAPANLSIRADTGQPKELSIEIVTDADALNGFLEKAGAMKAPFSLSKLAICGGIQQQTTDKPRFDLTQTLASTYYGPEIGMRITFPINKDGKGTVRLFYDTCELVDRHAGIEQNGYQCDFSYDMSMIEDDQDRKSPTPGAQWIELTDDGFKGGEMKLPFTGVGCERVEHPIKNEDKPPVEPTLKERAEGPIYQFTIEEGVDPKTVYNGGNAIDEGNLCGGVAEPGATELRWKSSQILRPEGEGKGRELYAEGKIDKAGSLHLYYDSCVTTRTRSEAGYECTFDYKQVDKIDGKWPKFDQKVALKWPEGASSGDPTKVEFKLTSVDTNLKGDMPKPVCRKLDQPVKVVGNPGFQLTEMGFNLRTAIVFDDYS